MTTTFLPPIGLSENGRRLGAPLARMLVLGLTGFVLVAVTAGGMALIFAGLLIAAGISVFLWRHPAWGAVLLVALLPVNRFLILLVFHFTGSTGATLAAQLWKDLFIVVLALRAVRELAVGPRPRVRYLDLLVVVFLAIATVYLVYPGPGLDLSLVNRLLGYRADALFLLAYVVGRAIPFDRRQLRWLLTSLVPGTLLVAGVAAGQILKPALFVDGFNQLGFQEFAGGAFGEVELVRDRGISGVQLPRASSLLFGDLALSFFCVFAVAVGAALFFTARRPGRVALGALTTVASLVTAVLTVTRSAVVASLLVVVVSAVLSRSGLRSLLFGAVCVLGAVLALVTNALPAEDIGALADPQGESIQGHWAAIEASFTTLEDHPMGRGLGTAGTIGQRFIPDRALTNENWFLQIATELGVVAGVLFLAITLIAAGIAFSTYGRLRHVELRRVAMIAAAGSVGFFLMANVLHAWEVPVLAMSFWLLVGITASAPDREPLLR